MNDLVLTLDRVASHSRGPDLTVQWSAPLRQDEIHLDAFVLSSPPQICGDTDVRVIRATYGAD
jgi:hypothetical protein